MDTTWDMEMRLMACFDGLLSLPTKRSAHAKGIYIGFSTSYGAQLGGRFTVMLQSQS